MQNPSDAVHETHLGQPTGTIVAHQHNPRFQQLLASAMEGNQESETGLLNEFGHALHSEGVRHESR